MKTINQIRADYLACANRWITLGAYRVAASYIAVLEIEGIETWTPQQRENKRIELLNTMGDS